MKTTKLFAIALLLITGCTKENEISTNTGSPTELSSETNMFRARTSRPFKIEVYSTIDPNPAIPPTACSGDLPGLANPGHFLHGNATHIGLINSANSRLQDVSCDLSFATAQLTTTVAGQIAASNGDLIYFTANDVINVYNLLTNSGTSGEITGNWTITGGTGAFAGATGSFVINGYVSFVTFTLSFTGDGTISY
jgi:hypothetical protein